MRLLFAARFLLLIGHITLNILLITDRDFHTRLCIAWDYNDAEYISKEREFLIGLGLSLGLLSLELLLFFTGVSLLNIRQCVFSIIQHVLGCLCLTAFLWSGWQCGLFWWLFGLTIAAPALTEVIVLTKVILSTTLAHQHEQHYSANQQLQQ